MRQIKKVICYLAVTVFTDSTKIECLYVTVTPYTEELSYQRDFLW